ncbi:MAG: phycobiliprotein lyase [Cyanobium sp.]
MTDFPPEDICSFLQLSAGDWLGLRSLLEAEDEASSMGELPLGGEESEPSQPWHASERAEVHMALVQPTSEMDWGGLEIFLTNQPNVTLIFHKTGTVAINAVLGNWNLGEDGSLVLTVEEENRRLEERIWFRKPNLRLRCTLEQFADGRPGRASFSSEIRRVQKPGENPHAH